MPQRVVTLFCELARIPSPSGKERAAANYVLAYLRGLGLDPHEDGSAPLVPGEAGNIVCRLPGAEQGGVPIMLCSHLDTVPPEGSIEPVVADGVIRNAAGTILGADNKSAIAAMLEAARRIVKEHRPHAGVELVFTVAEEVGLQGAKNLDLSSLEARLGYVYDQAAPIGEVILGAPYHRELHAGFIGRAAHSGIAPEEGRSAIVACARAIADFRLGRIDEETTANVGVIRGGQARNIVPGLCELEAEIRSHDEKKQLALIEEMLETIAFAAEQSECRAETKVVEIYRGYRFKPDDLPVALARHALESCGIEPRLGLTGGGADASIFNAGGLASVNLSNGMAHIHSPEEEIAVDDLTRMVDVTLALVDAAREASAATDS
jgi:tripeptide aminopeptidase